MLVKLDSLLRACEGGTLSVLEAEQWQAQEAVTALEAEEMKARLEAALSCVDFLLRHVLPRM